MLDFAAILPVLLAGAGAAMSGWKTLTKLRTRNGLSDAVRKNAPDFNELRIQLDAKNLDAAEAVIRKHIPELSPAEQREAEAALAQPSSTGRASYIRGVAAQSEASPRSLEMQAKMQIENTLTPDGLSLIVRQAGQPLISAIATRGRSADDRITLAWDGVVNADRILEFFSEMVSRAGDDQSGIFRTVVATPDSDQPLRYQAAHVVPFPPEAREIAQFVLLEHGQAERTQQSNGADYTAWSRLGETLPANGDSIGVSLRPNRFLDVLDTLARFLSETALLRLNIGEAASILKTMNVELRESMV